MTKPHTRDLSVATQLGRVIAIMSDGKPRTLRDIERECWSRYGHADTQAAIAAMLAATAAHAPWESQLRFVPRNGFCIPNRRNDRVAADKRAARRRRNIAKRG